MYEVFRVDKKIEILGARAGDILICDLEDPEGAITVLREHHIDFMSVVRSRSENLTPLFPEDCSDGQTGPDCDDEPPARKYLSSI